MILHNVVTGTDRTIKHKEIVLGAFVDTDKAFG
jgi:hypothetical protein